MNLKIAFTKFLMYLIWVSFMCFFVFCFTFSTKRAIELGDNDILVFVSIISVFILMFTLITIIVTALTNMIKIKLDEYVEEYRQQKEIEDIQAREDKEGYSIEMV